MGPGHAVKDRNGGKRVLPIHYDTFPGIKQDAGKFAERLKGETGIEGLVLKAGDRAEI